MQRLMDDYRKDVEALDQDLNLERNRQLSETEVTIYILCIIYCLLLNCYDGEACYILTSLRCVGSYPYTWGFIITLKYFLRSYFPFHVEYFIESSYILNENYMVSFSKGEGRHLFLCQNNLILFTSSCYISYFYHLQMSFYTFIIFSDIDATT